ncbi:MAG: single-stranded DNA-binding protein [Rickettsiaceae bacterium]|nr:single-stranded DNA-binding protein [Rickettsiaceae bacterium]
MVSLNKVTLIGNCGKDPEIRTTSDGKEIANFSIATSESWNDKTTGERKEKTEWHRVVVFNEGLVRIVKNYVKKGTSLYVEGSLQTRKWQDTSGVEKYTTEVVLQGYSCILKMLSSAKGGDANSSSASDNSFDHNDLDDEIPF